MESEQAVDEAAEYPVADDGHDRTIDAVDTLLDQVEAALGRLDDGTYGTCRTCSGVIDDHRLAATPTAEECSACAESAPEGAESPWPERAAHAPVDPVPTGAGPPQGE
jgi:RNA polymerase-binding transcription factor DksA